jgi:hypothetical protein
MSCGIARLWDTLSVYSRGDIAEFSPKTTRRLVPPGDTVALADAINRILTRPIEVPGLSRLSTWHDYADAVHDLLECMVNAQRDHDSEGEFPRLMAEATIAEECR